MKRWSTRMMVLGCLLATGLPTVEAGQLFQRVKRERQETPPRYVRAPNAWNYVFRDKEGKVQVRKVYPGYADQFPTPALFYYGYPHSGDDTGLGF